MKTKLLLLLLSSMLMGAACQKGGERIDYLTEATETGANTFSCVVNGKVFKAKASFNHPSPAIFYSNKNAISHLLIEGSDYSSSPELNVGLKIKTDNLTVGSYLLDKTYNYLYGDSDLIGGRGSYNATSSDGNTIYYETNANTKGTLSLTKVDLVNHIIAGRFEMKVINASGQVLNITDGRFDMKY